MNIREEEKGAVLPEAALTFALFFFVIFFCIELALFVLDVNSLQYSLDRAVRSNLVSDSNINVIKTQVTDYMDTIGAGVALAPANVRICPGFRQSSCATESRGTANNFFTVSIVGYSRPFLILPFSFPVELSISARNDNY